jgi:hypothetical protein
MQPELEFGRQPQQQQHQQPPPPSQHWRPSPPQQHPTPNFSRPAPAEPFPDLQSDWAPGGAPPIPPQSGMRSQSPQLAVTPPILVPASMRPGPPVAASPPMLQHQQFAPPPGQQGRGFGPGPPSPGFRGPPPGGTPGQPPGMSPGRAFPMGPPSPGMRPPGPINPHYRSPSPSLSSYAGGPPMAHRPNPMAALPARTTSLQQAHGPVRSATADAVGVDRGRAHRQDSDLSGSRPGARPSQLGIPTTPSHPPPRDPDDVVESPTSIAQWEWEWERQKHSQGSTMPPPTSSPALPVFPETSSRPQSPARMPSAPTRSYTPTMQPPRTAPLQQQPFSPPEHPRRMRTASPGPGRAVSPDPRMLGGAAPPPRGPPSLARSASYDVVEPPRSLGNTSRPGSPSSMRGDQHHPPVRSGSSPLVKLGDSNMLQGLGLVERGGAQRVPAQTMFAHHAQPQRPVIVDPSAPHAAQAQSARIHMSPPPMQSQQQQQRPPPPNVSPLLHPGGFTGIGSPLQSPHRSPIMGTSPNIPSPMSATFGHAGPASPPRNGSPAPPVSRGTSPRPPPGARMMPPPQGQYAVPSRPGTPQLGPQFHGQAF